MRLDFYLDPVCPWCWITSRWLTEVMEHRDLRVRWRSFSLFLKNEPEPDSRGYDRYLEMHRALRVMEALRDRHGDGCLASFYTELGRRIHHDRERPLDMAAAIDAVGLDAATLGATDDESWDEPIRASMKDAMAIAGDDVGVPLITFDGERGFFGPVISPAPTGDAAAELFDHVEALAQYPGFWEIKRTRTSRPEFGPRP